MYLMRDIPESCRPRERLLKNGVKSLSDVELLAILLGTGAPGKNVLEVARDLLREGGWKHLRKRDIRAMCKDFGIGDAKAARIAAVFELTYRITLEVEVKERFDPSQLGPKLISGYGHYPQEHLGAVLLDSKHRLGRQREIFVGTLSRAVVSPGEILRFALSDHASAVVLFHNHPSGDPTPSPDDIAMTHKLREAMKLLDIELVDHLVVSEHRYMSMKQASLF